MSDQDCSRFLQRALPELGLRWEGFRGVRKQVCKRIARRIHELGLDTLEQYRAYLETRSEEWAELELLCRVTISRFYRDRGTFEVLASEVLPQLATSARDEGRTALSAWSAGCGAGEEPYTLSIVYARQVAPRFPLIALTILGTDVDAHQIERARAACYPAGALSELPEGWREWAFSQTGRGYCLREEFRGRVVLSVEDMRRTLPDGPFDLVLCRNLAFTYFDARWQDQILISLAERLRPHGVLVLGRHERLPEGSGFDEIAPGRRIYRRQSRRHVGRDGQPT